MPSYTSLVNLAALVLFVAAVVALALSPRATNAASTRAPASVAVPVPSSPTSPCGR